MINDMRTKMAGMVASLILLGGCTAAKPDVPRIEDYLPRAGRTPIELPGEAPEEAAVDRRVPGEMTEKPLTVEACVRIALDGNPLLQAAREGVAAAKQAIGEAKAPYYPTLDLQASYSRWQSHAFLPSGLSASGIPGIIGPTDDWLTALEARYLVFDSGERRARLASAVARGGMAAEEAAAARQDVALAVHIAYYGLLSTLRGELVAEENLARAEDHLRLARDQADVGAVPKADVVRAKVEVADSRLALVRARSIVNKARGSLNVAMGLPVSLPVGVETESEELTAPQEADLAAALEASLDHRPALRAGLQKIAAARGEVRAAESAYGPRITARGKFGRRDAEFFPEDEEWSAGISLELPIFTGFDRQHRLSREKAELSAEEARLRQLILQVQDEVWTAYYGLKEAYEAFEATVVLVEDAKESLRLVRERYEAGASTINDLLDAQTALARAEVKRSTAELDYFAARAVFKRAVGVLLPQDHPASTSTESEPGHE